MPSPLTASETHPTPPFLPACPPAVEPSGGRIVIDGIDTASIGLYDLRSRLALVPQVCVGWWWGWGVWGWVGWGVGGGRGALVAAWLDAALSMPRL